jgi:hypothetical protein
MQAKNMTRGSVVAVALAHLFVAHASAQPLTGPPANPQYEYSTPMPPGVAAPETVETRLGTLRFDSGMPDQATTDKLYDNLDFQRAVQAYLLGLPPVNQLSNRTAILSMGPVNTTVPIWEPAVGLHSPAEQGVDRTRTSRTSRKPPCISYARGEGLVHQVAQARVVRRIAEEHHPEVRPQQGVLGLEGAPDHLAEVLGGGEAGIAQQAHAVRVARQDPDRDQAPPLAEDAVVSGAASRMRA